MSIIGNMAGCYSPMGKTFIITDENGNEITGVVTEQEQIFTATDNDVREGMVYAGDGGVSTGTKIIPTYHTYQGVRVVPKGSAATIPNIDENIDYYDYTKLQSIICSYNTSLADSVAAQKVLIEDNIYNAQSVESISIVTKNHESKIIELGITNDSETHWVNRYFMYKEIK